MLNYNPNDIKRLRITIIDEDTTERIQRYKEASIRVHMSSVLRDLEYQITSSPPLVKEQIPEPMSTRGTIEFSSPLGETFCVVWTPRYYERYLQFSIKRALRPEHDGRIQEQVIKRFRPEFDFSNTAAALSLKRIHKSDGLELSGTSYESLKVHISIAKEIFIGRCSYVLTVEGRVLKSNPTLDPKVSGMSATPSRKLADGKLHRKGQECIFHRRKHIP
jgi:hypothetical protein